MTASDTFHVVDDSRYQEHRAPPGHPEQPDRLVAVGQALRAFRDRLSRVPARPAEADEILRIHSEHHLRTVEAAAKRAPLHLDSDTYVSPRSAEVAKLAAGGAVDLARLVARGDAQCGLAAVRPPGHHAEADRAMGFCLFNNVAIAARALQQRDGLDRILIVDWDVHHGNGTQHSFEEDPSVLYLSTHQFPFYPGTGDAAEVGRGRGEGSTVNVPMPAGCGDAEYIGVFQRIVVPVARRFHPDMILVSCGFDAHRDDPLASMEVTGDGYGAMTRILRALADDLCGGRLVFVLEGGYSPAGLRDGTTAVLQAMLEPAPKAPLETGSVPPNRVLRRTLERVAAAHSSRIPGLDLG
jgi:acetoin utilization deacetylase AcuC-like enzyme